ncbi:MAG: T9SS type A sorting domain-containing protein [Flavobacteriaceae bacterium]|nr:T9SS type A sorting domain-containing protein [Flavobacteriaceae bacterium]
MNRKSLITIVSITLFIAVNCNATTYYVSTISGNDSNTGTTISQAWKTIAQVNSFAFVPGDSILFKRNEIWRGQLIPKSGSISADIYYGAYDEGVYPAILGSLNFNNNSDWVNLYGNIWKCNAVFSTDIGNIIFDNATIIGYKKWLETDLQNQNDFWYDLLTGQLLIYSTSNPSNLYFEIELALRTNIIHQENTHFVTYENLSIKYGGAHGFGGGNTSNITIKSCEISYIGGGDLNMDGTIRYGNGVEFWGNATNNIVEKCKIWEIYDTGVTNQNHTTTVIQQNIKYQNNIIWNCGLSSFEFWCKPETSEVDAIHFENNTCLYAGSGWGIQRPDYFGIHVLISDNSAQSGTISIKNNIFFEAQRSIYAFYDNANGTYELDYNLIYQPTSSDSLFVYFPSLTTFTYSDFNSYTSVTGYDENSVTGNPDFENQAGFDFSLTNSSIAINSGTNVGVTEDFEGNPRPIHGEYDIGAYEYTGLLSTPEIEFTKNIILYPNPTKNIFRISLNTKMVKDCDLIFYNVNGKELMRIEKYTIDEVVNIEHLANGSYWIVLKNKKKIIGIATVLVLK